MTWELLGEQILASPARVGSVRLVCIDGPAGSGKTTSASELSHVLGAPVVHMDDLYDGWDGALVESTWDRIKVQILQPLLRGASATYDVFSWHRGRFALKKTVEPSPVVIVEGVGSAAQPMSEYCSFVIWVHSSGEVQVPRILARDGVGSRVQVETFIERQTVHFALDGTRERADVVIDGSPAVLPSPGEFIRLG